MNPLVSELPAYKALDVGKISSHFERNYFDNVPIRASWMKLNGIHGLSAKADLSRNQKGLHRIKAMYDEIRDQRSVVCGL